MGKKCEHGLTTKECFVCASAKYGERADLAQRGEPLSDEQQAALSLMLDHFGNDKRVQCLRPLVKSAHGIGGDE